MSNVKSLNSGLYLLFVKLFPELRLSCTGSFYIYLKTSLVIMQEKKMTVPFFFFFARHICFFMIYLKKNHTYPISWQAWLLSWHPPSQSLYLYVLGPGPQAEGKDKWESKWVKGSKTVENTVGYSWYVDKKISLHTSYYSVTSSRSNVEIVCLYPQEKDDSAEFQEPRRD